MGIDMSKDQTQAPATPPPPAGFSSWLDYAVSALDTRTAWHEFQFSDDRALQEFTRDDMQRAAESELRRLRRQAGMPDTYPTKDPAK